MLEKLARVNGKNVFYRQTGEGAPVMLLHGFGEDGSIWNRQFGAWNQCQLIIPDLPGTGRSELTDDMSIEGMAKTICDFMKAIGLAKCKLIGHSMGGYIILAFLESNPEMAEAFGLFHSTTYADSEERKETRRKGIDFIKKHGAFEFLKTVIPNLYSPVTKEKNPELPGEQIEVSHEFSAEALIRYYNAMIERPDRTHVLKETTLPALFVLGRYDNATPLADGLKQCYLPSISYVYILENSGHMGMREEPQASNKFLQDFINL
jgi:pimeloyl-ACP methyl ester carboxylesterase